MKRQSLMFGLTCNVLTVLIVVYAVWAPRSFAAEWPELRVTNWTVARIPCGRHLIGSVVFYVSPDDPEHEQRSFACRDWWNGRWVIITTR